MTQKANKPVVFVTGGSRGMGKAIVARFKAEGWLTVACGVNTTPTEADLNLLCDVADAAQVRATMKAIMDKYGRLDAVINNAGIGGSNPLAADQSDDLWHRIVAVNLHGTYYVSKYALPYLPDNTGRIVNISSVLGLHGVPDASAYTAAKHGVVGFTKALACDLAARKITVNVICPGWVRTDMAVNRMRKIGMTEADLATAIPLGKYVEPEEIADLTYFLVTSPTSHSMTGQVIALDGGWTI